MELFLETQNNVFDVPIILEIVPIDVPALVRSDVLDAHGIFAETVSNRPVCAALRRDVYAKTNYIEGGLCPYCAKTDTCLPERPSQDQCTVQ